jgi:hypothetical protein
MSTVKPPAAIESVTLIFKLNNEMVQRSLDGVSDADCWRRPTGNGNPLGWLAGHATISRAGLLKKLGHSYDCGLGDLFNRGAAPSTPEAYPPRSVIEAAWKQSRQEMRAAFERLTEASLAAPPSGQTFSGVTTMADLIAFYAFHESYHVGQMGYVRKLLGYSGIAG